VETNIDGKNAPYTGSLGSRSSIMVVRAVADPVAGKQAYLILSKKGLLTHVVGIMNRGRNVVRDLGLTLNITVTVIPKDFGPATRPWTSVTLAEGCAQQTQLAPPKFSAPRRAERIGILHSPSMKRSPELRDDLHAKLPLRLSNI
jgi:hypothetical protein